MKKIIGFFHVAQMGDWKVITESMIWELITSCLEEVADKIWVGIVGEECTNHFNCYEPIAYRDPNLKSYEFKTIEFLHNYCKNNDGKVFYIHTKGVSKDVKSVQQWRHLMQYYIIGHWERCAYELDNKCDVVGVNWQPDYRWPHFSGNFWWANTDYIRKLKPIPTVGPRTNAEFWIGTGQPKVCCLHDSGVDHYHEEYPPELYKNRAIVPKYYKNTKKAPPL